MTSYSDGDTYKAKMDATGVKMRLLGGGNDDEGKLGGEYRSLAYSDGDSDSAMDDFGEMKRFINRERLVRTGRQRKRLAARTKGGEFQSRKKKRRVHFCCISSDIDIQKLYDYLIGSGGTLSGWKYQLYPGGDVLHLFKPGRQYNSQNNNQSNNQGNNNIHQRTTSTETGGQQQTDATANQGCFEDSLYRISNPKSQEVFVFDFGAAVFWGFSRGEEANLLKTFRMFVTKGGVDKEEFLSGEDDMAFITSPQEDNISIANDFITLPDYSPVKQRLSVSFAIAQSSVLAIFEARIEHKVEEYKYIPETLAAYGKVHLSERQLGIMIGEVFVIRHDVNLHTEILDTPAFFWKEEMHEENYHMVMEYLEMSGRTSILNKRLDLLRELLDVLQHQMENEHGVKLEWIVIWLIVVEVVLQAMAIISG
jgi:uncharacterized Rmd1/YagE family protein